MNVHTCEDANVHIHLSAHPQHAHVFTRTSPRQQATYIHVLTHAAQASKRVVVVVSSVLSAHSHATKATECVVVVVVGRSEASHA